MDKPVSITKASQIEVGEYYWIRGSDSWGLPIPPQIALVLAPPKQLTMVGIPFVEVEIMAKVGDQLVRYTTNLDLWSVNIKPGVKGISTGHGYHNKELVRVTHPTELRHFLGDESYKEVMVQAKSTRQVTKPKIIAADKWGKFQ